MKFMRHFVPILLCLASLPAMATDWGNVPVGEVVPCTFETYGTNGESLTMSGFAATDIEIIKDGSVTVRSSDAGYTLMDTDGIDIGTRTGFHGFTVDTGDNTDAGFYAAGGFFNVWVDSVTVNTQTVRLKACTFRLVAAEGTAGTPSVDAVRISNDATAADNAELMFDGTGYAGGTTKLGVDAIALSGDTAAADNAELFFDGTGYAGTNNVIPTVTNVTNQVTANATAISGDSTAADNLELAFDDTAGAVPWIGIADQGTASSATSTTIVLRAATPYSSDDANVGATVWAYGSTQGYWQHRTITAYTTADDTATVSTWDVTPSGTITYKIFGTAPGNSPTAAQVADAVWDEDATAHQTQGTFGQGLGDPAADTDTIFALTNTIAGQTDDIGVAGAGLTAADDAVMTRLGAPAGASVSADIAEVEGETDDIGIAGAGLTAIPDVDTLLEALVVLGAEQTADSGTTTTIVDAALTQATTDWFKGVGVHFTSGTLLGQDACVTGFTPASDTLTFTPAVTTAVTTHTYYMLPNAECFTGSAGAGGATAAEVWTYSTRALTELDEDNTTIDINGQTVGTATTVGTVNALAANSLTAAAAAADLTTELQSGLATASSLTTVSGLVDDLEARLGTPIDLGSGLTIAANLSDIEGFADNLPTDPADASDLAALIDALPTAAENARQLLDTLVDGGADVEEMLCYLTAVLVNKSDFNDSTNTSAAFRNFGDTGDMVTVTYSGAAGQDRSAVTLAACGN